MKKLATLLLCLIFISITIVGKFYYDKKLAANIEKSTLEISSDSFDLYDSLTKNMNNQLRELVLNKLEDDETIRILAVGSRAIMTGDAENLPWPFQLVNSLDGYYGNGKFELEIINLENISTNHLIDTNRHIEIASYKTDIFIFEPLILNDNGIVMINHTLSNIQETIETVKAENPGVFIIIQPPNPIHNPTFYLEQVEQLKDFAITNEYEFLDHWKDWPNWNDEEIKNYLNGVYPNPEGQDIWANYINNYFIYKD
ncbi:SGNH/GDSL hydrolase family protein [Bacillus alkalisoli]|uniref:SGNH/GDSL hydrolase family protein n=1 Tax=Bacillus alkalisoli TaxID=2011008 RepID=UPI000C2492E1|nr:SGNH/GDSL hydrolase family protein [Bacillus alkalisoli]